MIRQANGPIFRELVPYKPDSIIRRGLTLVDEVGLGTGKIRLVVVDDIAQTRLNLASLLSLEADMEVVGLAGDGQEGIEVVREVHPDVVLMDIHMPTMDGLTATEIIAAGPRAPAVIIISIRDEKDYIRRSMLAGAKDYLIKPFPADALVAAIRSVHELGVSTADDVGESEFEETSNESEHQWLHEGAPFNVCPSEQELPSGFHPWGGSGPWHDYERIGGEESHHWNYVFSRGSRPATSSPFISLHLIICPSLEIAREKLVREVVGARDNMGLTALPTFAGFGRWPRAGIFSEPRELPITLGDESELFEAVFFGRMTVWGYVRIRKVLVGIQAQDVSMDVVKDQLRRMVDKVTDEFSLGGHDQ
jgi:DNA-binding NarL/FixJ family response regulator